ncbi:pentatricopeptide repeat-containing protein At3g14580, mitochondrial [Andrographis paniculata]|uniref:pentatricopeptide repeat-containing protein At3g14580, mitochondrial n=1 Tax=Andrographis paniculata TaxID=175694 RepID=UPI0021E89425|nr:pentatricopeptide repeat-containing protein At3g14580, mitochondrial [Andrographis paniculata]
MPANFRRSFAAAAGSLNQLRRFHEFAPTARRRLNLPGHGDHPSFPDLAAHRDWLSTPQVIRIFQTLENPNHALPLLDQLSRRRDYRPNESLYSTVIHKLELAGDFDGIDAVMARIKAERNCRLSDAFFRNVIKIYGHTAGRINRAIATLFAMPSYKCWPSTATFNFVMNLLVNSKQYDVVHQVYAAAPELGVEIDACCLNIIIKGLCNCGKIEAARKVFDEFPDQKCAPNLRTFSTLIHGLCQHGRVDEAFVLMDRMEADGVEADAVVFNILISGLRKLRRVEEGIKLFDQAMIKGCEPNPATYQEVVYCLLDGRRLGEAKSFAARMIDKGMKPSYETYKRLIIGFCEDNAMEDVEWTLKWMSEHRFVPKMGMWKQMVRCVVTSDEFEFGHEDIMGS